MSQSVFAFGDFVLDPDAGSLTRGGRPVALNHRGLQLLHAFLHAPKRTLRKSALMDAAWPGISVEESNLSVQIAALRKLLGPQADGGNWIATIPRVGYRFVGEVRALDVSQTKSTEAPPS